MSNSYICTKFCARKFNFVTWILFSFVKTTQGFGLTRQEQIQQIILYFIENVDPLKCYWMMCVQKALFERYAVGLWRDVVKSPFHVEYVLSVGVLERPSDRSHYSVARLSGTSARRRARCCGFTIRRNDFVRWNTLIGSGASAAVLLKNRVFRPKEWVPSDYMTQRHTIIQV